MPLTEAIRHLEKENPILNATGKVNSGMNKTLIH